MVGVRVDLLHTLSFHVFLGACGSRGGSSNELSPWCAPQQCLVCSVDHLAAFNSKKRNQLVALVVPQRIHSTKRMWDGAGGVTASS